MERTAATLTLDLVHHCTLGLDGQVARTCAHPEPRLADPVRYLIRQASCSPDLPLIKSHHQLVFCHSSPQPSHLPLHRLFFLSATMVAPSNTSALVSSSSTLWATGITYPGSVRPPHTQYFVYSVQRMDHTAEAEAWP